jgi:hypothetical protein
MVAGQEELSPEEVRALVRREVTSATAPRVSREHIRLLKVRRAARQRPQPAALSQHHVGLLASRLGLPSHLFSNRQWRSKASAATRSLA